MTAKQGFVIFSAAAAILLVVWSANWPPAAWLFVVLIPLIVLGIRDMVQRRHTILRLYPVIGHFRYLFESVRKEIQQYFVESDIDGRPVSREFRSLVYQRAKGDRDTRPFGTIFDVYRDGYEWINHSLAPKEITDHDPRIIFGEKNCKQPYAAAPLNISAMSFGALSKNAIMALNKGAKMGGFFHNTGEGGLSPYHLKYGGDIVWQIGTAYFGCRTEEGGFNTEKFAESANLPVVKMIEIKLSQGAKPGHGGILPAAKLTKEIAAIRHVPMGKDVVSPPKHSTFDTPVGLLQFVAQLRDLSGSKPTGFKLCIGSKTEFLAICKAMLETGITPDFITIDGAEGGTGAAPIELTNSVGTPLRDALVFVNRALIGIGLRGQIRLIASGKAVSAFHIIRLLALGADTVNSARAMMFAVGCIQSRSCNTDKCPTGVATQDPARSKALDVDDKSKRVCTYQETMVENLLDVLAAAGLEKFEDLQPRHINQRVNGTVVRNYDEMHPTIPAGCLLSEASVPERWRSDWEMANAHAW
ncbi:MAG: FMN-binding glutamate synthase family protein [Gammaproteobacteria bacterium]|nr:MAG: FMN-binding glutamate synthase family protein [Gammaproteobacteria bacterium]